MRRPLSTTHHEDMTTTPAPTKNTPAFFAQAGLSFGIALVGLVFAIIYLPVDPWIRAFLAMTALFLVSSSFTLAKVVRDAQDDKYLVNKVDEARLEKLLAEQDRFQVPVKLAGGLSVPQPPSSDGAPS
jgi:hypothetical protein